MLPPDAERHDSAGMTLEEIVAVCRLAARRGLRRGPPAQRRAGDLRGHRRADGRPGPAGDRIRSGAGHQRVSGGGGGLRVELTAPEIAQTIILTRTARTDADAAGGGTFARLAQSRATMCIFLSTDKIAETAATLAESYGPECPAAVVYHASWPDEQVVRGTLADVAGRVAAAGITRTALFLVGAALERPLHRASKLYDKSFGHGHRQGTGK